MLVFKRVYIKIFFPMDTANHINPVLLASREANVISPRFEHAGGVSTMKE